MSKKAAGEDKKPLLTKKGKPAKHPTMIGNKFAEGHGCGRPPETSDEELIQLGQDMLKAIEEHPDWWFLQDYAVYAKRPSRDLYDFADRKVFSKYYDRAKEILGLRIIRITGKVDEKGRLIGLHPALANRFVNVYFRDVKAVEKEMKKDNLEAAKQLVTLINKGQMDDSGAK